LSDAKIYHGEMLAVKFNFALSRSGNVSESASWLEGFLKGSGTILIIDERLWSLVDQWVQHLSEEDFIALLPLMRRTFSQFSHAERRKIGDKAKKGGRGITVKMSETSLDNLDEVRAVNALPVVTQLLGIQKRKIKSRRKV